MPGVGWGSVGWVVVESVDLFVGEECDESDAHVQWLCRGDDGLVVHDIVCFGDEGCGHDDEPGEVGAFAFVCDVGCDSSPRLPGVWCRSSGCCHSPRCPVAPVGVLGSSIDGAVVVVVAEVPRFVGCDRVATAPALHRAACDSGCPACPLPVMPCPVAPCLTGSPGPVVLALVGESAIGAGGGDDGAAGLGADGQGLPPLPLLAASCAAGEDLVRDRSRLIDLLQNQVHQVQRVGGVFLSGQFLDVPVCHVIADHPDCVREGQRRRPDHAAVAHLLDLLEEIALRNAFALSRSPRSSSGP